MLSYLLLLIPVWTALVIFGVRLLWMTLKLRFMQNSSINYSTVETVIFCLFLNFLESMLRVKVSILQYFSIQVSISSV